MNLKQFFLAAILVISFKDITCSYTWIVDIFKRNEKINEIGRNSDLIKNILNQKFDLLTSNQLFSISNKSGWIDINKTVSIINRYVQSVKLPKKNDL